MALSALHRSTLIDGMPTNFDLDALVSSFMASSLQNLRHELQAKEGVSKYALLTTIRTLCVCEIHSGRADARSWRVHVEGAIALLGTTRAMSDISSADDRESQWLIDSWYASIESLMALTTRRGLSSAQIEQFGPRALLRGTQAENRYLDIYTAYSTDLNDSFKEIRAAAWKRRRLNANGDKAIVLSNWDLDEEADWLESSIRSMTGNSAFRPNDLQVLSQHEVQQFEACDETYYHTALIHILRRVRQLPRSDLRVQASVKRIIECCLKISPADGLSPWVMLTTPLFTAGCEALGEDRAMVRQLLKSMYDSLRIRNIQRSLGILEMSWSNKEDNDDWESFLGKMIMGKVVRYLTLSLCLATLTAGHEQHAFVDQGQQISEDRLAELKRKWNDEWAFSGISTFAHLPHLKCLVHPEELYDIAVIGSPFDTAVSYRPGARFGPRAIRAASARQTANRGFNPRAGFNPYTSWATIKDCGDIPINPFDNELALRQMTEAFVELAHRPSKSGTQKPRLITLGGDHSLALPALRALNQLYGPVAVLHFDAHLDTWHPAKYPSAWSSEQSQFNHGSMYWIASNEGLIANGSSVHAGLRTRLSGDGWDDYDDDDRQGFFRISADDIDDIGGPAGVAKLIVEKIGTEIPVYLSVDIDVVDPGLAPGTGTPEPGGWTSRELIRILRNVDGLNVVGADIVEVAPAYDGRGEQTALVAAQIVYEILTSMVKRGLTVAKVPSPKEEVKSEL
ncbi:hypothetical protein V500_01084 [Pseudogymnoascus sp. VKM F-4518 (FW-2643)]|nr:hypothetical protein V500_01084 [Pseudogymnoascus sp. VKM F-4518 (FW-2643)]